MATSINDEDALGSAIHTVFSRTAREHHDRIALSWSDGTMTYGELDKRSNEIAYGLLKRGVKPGAVVGLYTQRSPEAIVGILGILKIGAAYVPFDPSYPVRLLRYAYENAAPALILIQRSLLDDSDSARFWDGDAFELASVAAPADASVQFPDVDADDAAYVMYTSGSTGQPKGVVVPHRGVVRLVIDNHFTRFAADEVFLQMAPLAFDASTFEIWGALLHGARLAILPTPQPSLDEIADAIGHYGVTTLWLTAGLFHLMVEHRLDGLKPLRQLLAGGDVLSPPHVEKALRALPHCAIINGYGPTENTTFTCCYTVPRSFSGTTPIPIGTPIAHTHVYILNEMLQPVASGEEGELYAGGLGVALGYLNRADLTAERFIDDPFTATAGAKLYKTGDRVRYAADGTIEFRGRVDRQIKLNGKRIELDEIEHCLRRSSLIGDAAVVSIGTEVAQRRIAAFVTPRKGTDVNSVEVAALRHHLKQELPPYMLPATITVLTDFPLSPTGKVDRARLPQPNTSDASLPGSHTAPRNDLEAALLRIWVQVLGRTAIGVDDNFFDLGGTSLQLMKVHALVQEMLRKDVTIADLTRYPTIRALASWMSDVPSNRTAEPPLPLSTITSIDRPVSISEYYHAAVGTSRHTLERPREAVIVLEGICALRPDQWRRALDQVAAANPGTRVRLCGERRHARWQSDGAPPRLRILDICDWDTMSHVGAEFITALPLSLETGPVIEVIVAPRHNGQTLVILRASHAVLDGSGGLHFLQELFRALRGEPLLGSNASFSEMDLMRSLAVKCSSSRPLRHAASLTGLPQGSARGDEFRRIRLGTPKMNLLDRLAVALAEFAHQHSDLPAVIAVHVDLRRHAPGLRSTMNFVSLSMLFVHLDKYSGRRDFRRRLQEMLAARMEAVYPRIFDMSKWLPLPWLDRLLSRTPNNYRIKKPWATVGISDMGMQEAAALSCPGFMLHDMIALPAPGSLPFLTLTGVNEHVNLVMTMPKVLASDGRFEALLTHLLQRLSD